MKTDGRIQLDVLRELRWDPRVAQTDVGVEVDNGVVTLTGTVNNYPERLAAQEAAHRVQGVLDVANDIQVKLPGSAARTDTEIAQAVRDTLRWCVQVPHERMQSTVADGIVTLDGTVDYYYQREAAERAVRNLTGVRGVVNGLSVTGPAAEPDTVRREIEEVLERRAHRAARSIDVSVTDGTVTLSGPVHSLTEREAVLAAARFTPGVREVDNRLRVERDA
jgi:osmotically-inducible protein OsmY